jgi:uncharacterized protein (TIRG00374 family)
MKRLINVLKVISFFGFGFLILWLVYRKQNQSYIAQCALEGIPEADCNLMLKVWEDITTANFFWIFVILVCFILSNVSRALRWKMQFKPLGYEVKAANTFFAIMLGYFANLGIPRAGEFLKAGVITQYENVPFEHVMGTIVIDRAMDFICLLLVIMLSVFLEYEVVWSYLSTNTKLADQLISLVSSPFFYMAILIFGGIVWYFLFYKNENKLLKKFRLMLIGFLSGIRAVADIDKPFLFIFYSIFIWVMYYLMTYLCFFAFVPTAHLGMTAGLVVFVFGTLGMVIPTPGGMGSYHFLIGEGLKIYGVNDADGFSFANIIFFSIQIFCNIGFGLLALVLLPMINKKTA